MKKMLIARIAKRYECSVRRLENGILEVEFGNKRQNEIFKAVQSLYKQVKVFGVKAIKFAYCEIVLFLDELNKYSIKESWLLAMREYYDLALGTGSDKMLISVD